MKGKGNLSFTDKGAASSYLEEFASSATLSEKKYKCPKCGYVGAEHIDVSMGGYEGKYCLNCYAKWINKNFPKLEKMEDK